MMQWDDLRFFLEVLDSGSLSAASRRLGVNQTTVGRRLSALERDVGEPLFYRSRGGLRATSAALGLAPAARAMAEAAREAEGAVSARAGAARGTVTVTSTEAFVRTRVVPRLAVLRQEHPDLDVVVVASNEDLDIASGEADVAVRLRRPLQESLIGRRAGEIAIGLYASHAYLQARGGPDPVTGWAGHDIVAHEQALARLPEARWLASQAASARAVLRANTVSCLVAAAVHGLGLAVLPRGLGDAEPDLVRLQSVDVPARPVWLVYARAFRHDPRVRAVVDVLARDLL